jgi:hypothetical protein
MAMIAGQSKKRDRSWHFVIVYVGIINIELEIIIDGLFGTHRVFFGLFL